MDLLVNQYSQSERSETLQTQQDQELPVTVDEQVPEGSLQTKTINPVEIVNPNLSESGEIK